MWVGLVQSGEGLARTEPRTRLQIRWNSCRLPALSPFPPSAAGSEPPATGLQTPPGPRPRRAPAGRLQALAAVRLHHGGGQGLAINKPISHAPSGHAGRRGHAHVPGPILQSALTSTVGAGRGGSAFPQRLRELEPSATNVPFDPPRRPVCDGGEESPGTAPGKGGGDRRGSVPRSGPAPRPAARPPAPAPPS